MKALLTSMYRKTGYCLGLLTMLSLLSGSFSYLTASPLEWMHYFTDNVEAYDDVDDNMSNPPVALSCLPEVNVSLGHDGYAVITSIMLVNAPAYPPFQYEVDIMGP